jgi:nondiscriminating glutamyl-tRNA synthetase
VRTALFNWLFARKHNGVVVLRSEDTDRERSKTEFEIEIVEALRWLHLDWDEGFDWHQEGGEWITSFSGPHGPYRQSERSARYRLFLEQLLASGDAYYCACTKEDLDAERTARTAAGLPPIYSGKCRAGIGERKPETIRFKAPEGVVTFPDMIRGDVSFDTGLFGDFVIAKDLDHPLYNFAVIVDDYDMAITHVIRGEEHLSNTPKQMVMNRALGFPDPIFAHLPLVLSADRKKLSKRTMDTNILSFRDMGYLPEAIVNFVALLGWHPQDDREILSLDELVAAFDLSRVQKAGAIFDEQKLDWLNGEYIKKLSDEALLDLALPILSSAGFTPERAFALRVVAAVRDRLQTVGEIVEYASFFFTLPAYEPSLLTWRKSTPEGAKKALEAVLEAFSGVSEGYTRADAEAFLLPLLGEDKGSLLWPLRAALSGLPASPDPYTLLAVLGKEESVRRITYALSLLS